MFDGFGQGADGFFAFGGQVGGVVFGKESEEVNEMPVGNVEIENPSISAGAFAFGGHAHFANTTASHHQVAFFGKFGEQVLECGVIFVGHQAGDKSGELGSFNEDHGYEGVTLSQL